MGKRGRRGRNRVKWFSQHQQPQTTEKSTPIKGTGINSTEKVTEVAKNDAPEGKPCHDGVVNVFSVGSVAVWGGKASDVLLYDDWDLMILCTDKFGTWEDNEPPTPVIQTKNSKHVWGDFAVEACPFIGICWEDYGLPILPDGWWQRLADKIREFGKEKVKMKVAVGCTGGHGRTGTVLSILFGLLCDGKEDPIAAIRRVYCHKVVESRSQISYIEEVTGLKTDAMPAWCEGIVSMQGYYSGMAAESSPSSGLARDGSVYEDWKRRYDEAEDYVYEKTVDPFTGEWVWTRVVKKAKPEEPLPNETGQGKDKLPGWDAVAAE